MALWKRDEDTVVAGDKAEDEDEPEPDTLEPVFEGYQQGEYLVICAIDEPAQAIASKDPVEIKQ